MGWRFDNFQLTEEERGNADFEIPLDDPDGNLQRPISESSARVAIELVYPDDFDEWEVLEQEEKTRAPIPHTPEEVFGTDDFGSEIFQLFLRRNNSRNTMNKFAEIFKERKGRFMEQIEHTIDHDESRRKVVQVFNDAFGGVVTEQAWTARIKSTLRVKSRYEIMNIDDDTRQKLISWRSFPMAGNWREQHAVLVEFHHVELEDLLNLLRYVHKKKGVSFVMKTFNLSIDGIKSGMYY